MASARSKLEAVRLFMCHKVFAAYHGRMTVFLVGCAHPGGMKHEQPDRFLVWKRSLANTNAQGQQGIQHSIC